MISSMLGQQALVIHLNDRHETVFWRERCNTIPPSAGPLPGILRSRFRSPAYLDRAFFFVDTTSFSGSKRLSRLNAAGQGFAKHGGMVLQ